MEEALRWTRSSSPLLVATGNMDDNEEGPAFDTGGSGAAGRSALRERCGLLNISPMHLVRGKLKAALLV